MMRTLTPLPLRLGALLTLALLLFAGCAQPTKVQDERKATTDLHTSVTDFHLKMRWGLWEQAAEYTAPAYRTRFEARYEELGEDYKITDLTVKSVKFDGPEATVDVQQSWYHEPNMTLQKERFIEDWKMVHGTWRLAGRMERAEWRKLNKAGDDEVEEEDDAAGEDSTLGEGEDSADAPSSGASREATAPR